MEVSEGLTALECLVLQRAIAGLNNYDTPSDGLEDFPNSTCLLQKSSDDICERTFICGRKSETSECDQTQLAQIKSNSSFVNLPPVIKGINSLNGFGQSLMPYSASYKSNKTFYVSVPEEDSISVQMRSFISRHNKDFSFEDSQLFSQSVCQPNDSSLVHAKETVPFDLGDNNLAHFYPGMVECIRRLWEFPWKKRAADHILQYYKRQNWIAHRKMLSKQKKISRTAKESTRFRKLCEYNSYNRVQRYRHTLGKCKHSDEDHSFTLNPTLASSVSILDLSPSQLRKMEICEIDSFCIKKRSLFPVTPNPEVNSKSTPKAGSSRTIILDKTYTHKEKTKIDGVSLFSSPKKLPGQNVFSAFPVLNNNVPLLDSLTASVNSEAMFSDCSFTPRVDIHGSPYVKGTNKDIHGSPYVKGTNKDIHNSPYVKRTNRHISDTTFTLTHVNKTPTKYPPSTCDAAARIAILDKTITYPNKTKINSFHFQESIQQLSKMAGALQKRFPLAASHSPRKHNATFWCKVNSTGDKPVNEPSHPLLNTTHTLKRSNSFSAFSQIHSPKSHLKLVRPSLCLEKTVCFQNNLKMDDTSSSLRHELSKLTNFARPLTRSNSFSSFPVVDKGKSDEIFDYVYKKETWDFSCEQSFSSRKVDQSCNIVCSLVNSPGSRRSKRRATNDLSSAMFKRQKSFDETFIRSTNYMSRSMDSSIL